MNINIYEYLVLKIRIEKSGGRKQAAKSKQNKPVDYAGKNDRTGEEKKWVLGKMGSVQRLN